MTTLRIARRRQGLKPEVLDEWIVRPDESSDSSKLVYIRSQLRLAQAEEPDAGWKLETRGTEVSWHPIQV